MDTQENQKISFFYTEPQLGFLCHPAHNLVTTQPELSQLKLVMGESKKSSVPTILFSTSLLNIVLF